MPQLRLLDSLADIPAVAWDALHGSSNPFVSHAFLSGLERHGCLRERWGWRPQHAALYEGATLVAAAPGYLKANSHGEFVFDQAWAAAYARYGENYYPKWLLAVPYTPVGGPRLLARDAATRLQLATAICDYAGKRGFSSIHINFLAESEARSLPSPWLARSDVQFHWQHRGWSDFDAFLRDLESKKRKNIRHERRQVAGAGVRLRRLRGREASEADLAAMHQFYCQTFADKGNHPALTLEFFQHLAATMPERLLLVIAERAGTAVAGALFLSSDDTLYGRYWGSREQVPGLHFETCYYQGIEHCLQAGLKVFEPGAQGEHKLARGFLPVTTHSRHWIRDPQFGAALATWCEEERQYTRSYADALANHSPYRHAPA